MRSILTTICFLVPGLVPGQILTQIETKWSDDFREWYIYTDIEDLEGFLSLRWPINNDWSEWEFEVGDTWGVARMKWRDDPNYWEIRVDGELITAQTRWRNDIREWRIKSDNHSFLFKSKWSNVLNEWETIRSSSGYFAVYSKWENDPRKWIIVDELEEDVPMSIKLAMTFIAVFHSIPK